MMAKSKERRQYQREWKALKRVREKADDPEGLKYRDWVSSLRSNYGMTVGEYELLETAQHGTCAICRQPETVHVHLSVDHDRQHDKTAIRGLLCGNCNRGIGCLGHDPERLRRAIAYLEGYELTVSRQAGPSTSE